MNFLQRWFDQSSYWLLWAADTNRFRSMGSGFREKKDQPMSYDFLVGILILLSIVVFIWILIAAAAGSPDTAAALSVVFICLLACRVGYGGRW